MQKHVVKLLFNRTLILKILLTQLNFSPFYNDFCLQKGPLKNSLFHRAAKLLQYDDLDIEKQQFRNGDC